MNGAAEHLTSIKARIVAHPHVVRWTVVRDEAQGDQGLFRYRPTLHGGDLCERLARQAAKIFYEEFGAVRVLLFGSAVRHASFTPWSDVDLAAWGIPPERFYAAVAAVSGLSADIKVDLVDPEDCCPALWANIAHGAVERSGTDL